MSDIDRPMDEGARRFIEAVGVFFEDAGIPRIGGRLLGLLLLADRPLSLDAIARALGVSRASVSTNGRLLLFAGMVERVSLPGDRRDYYQFAAHGWEGSIEVDIKAARTFRRLIADALDTVDPANVVGRTRLGEAQEFFSFLGEELSALLDRWRQRAVPAADGHVASSRSRL